MAEGHVCGRHTTHEWGQPRTQGSLCVAAGCWNGGRGLRAYSPRKFLKFVARKCHFLHSEHPNLPQNLC